MDEEKFKDIGNYIIRYINSKDALSSLDSQTLFWNIDLDDAFDMTKTPEVGVVEVSDFLSFFEKTIDDDYADDERLRYFIQLLTVAYYLTNKK